MTKQVIEAFVCPRLILKSAKDLILTKQKNLSSYKTLEKGVPEQLIRTPYKEIKEICSFREEDDLDIDEIMNTNFKEKEIKFTTPGLMTLDEGVTF